MRAIPFARFMRFQKASDRTEVTNNEPDINASITRSTTPVKTAMPTRGAIENITPPAVNTPPANEALASQNTLTQPIVPTTRSRTRSNISQIVGIVNLDGVTKSTHEKTQAEAQAQQKNLTQAHIDEMKTAYLHALSAKEDASLLASEVKKAPFSLSENGKINIEVSSHYAKNLLRKLPLDFQQFVREKYYGRVIKCELMERISAPAPTHNDYTQHSGAGLYEQMKQTNPTIARLRDELGFDIGNI